MDYSYRNSRWPASCYEASIGSGGFLTAERERDSLSHHGIPGMRWGIRRYQNEDGTLTDEGRRRYGIGEGGQISEQAKWAYVRTKSNDSTYKQAIQREKTQGVKISKRRQQLIEQYEKSGMPREQAEISAKRRENVERIVKVAGAVTIAAVAAYGIYKGRNWLMKNGDKKIKAGTELFRTSGSAGENMNRAGYVANNAVDAEKYAGMYGQQIQTQKGWKLMLSKMAGKDTSNFDSNVYQMRGQAAKDIKLAGDRNAKKVYEKLLKTDKQFAADNEVVKKAWQNQPVAVGKTDSYADFNTRLVDHDSDEAKRVAQRFYDALKEKGYGGVIDVNDRDQSGYHAKNPAILFNMAENITNRNVRTIPADEIARNAAKAKEVIARQQLKDVYADEAMKTVRNWSAYGVAIGGVSLAGLLSNNKKDREQAAIYKTVIRDYKNEHPGTKLSDSEILENQLGRKP